MNSNYKTNYRTLGLNYETNLIRYIIPYFANGYCSITVANYSSRELAPICKKKVINIFYLILLNVKILFGVTGTKKSRGNKQHLSLKKLLQKNF